MADDSSSGPLRLRGAGFGTIAGGITLGLLSVFLPYAPAAAGTVAVGVAVLFLSRRGDVPTGLWLGLRRRRRDRPVRRAFGPRMGASRRSSSPPSLSGGASSTWSAAACWTGFGLRR